MMSSYEHQIPSYSSRRELQAIYEEYIFGTQLGVDGARFLKFCKDFQLFDHSFRHVDVDVVFAKHKETGQRYLSFRGFRSALAQIAFRKKMDIEVLIEYIECNGALRTNTTSGLIPMPNRFHDDLQGYTGVHKAGGPTVVDRNNRDLSRIVDRS